MILKTPRLLLRPWREGDLVPFGELNADPDVMRHFPARLTFEESREWMEKARRHVEEFGWGWWAVELKGQAPFIGFIGLNRVPFTAPFTPAVEIGWRLARAHWGQGLAPEGARAALDFAFGPLALPEVVAFTAVGNHPSRRVMEKLGMARDPADDFHHPKVPRDHPLSLCVLYRARPEASPGES
jgi:RimJ/RimL family protein N-acetyltransferase